MFRPAAAIRCLSFALLVASATVSASDAAQQVSHPGPSPTTAAAGKSQTGIASVYANSFEGKKTASGERYHKYGLTAASRTLPLHSKAKVTNLRTGRAVKVTITDRGPYVKHRVIDLSPAAANHIGLTKKEGIAPVEVKPAAPSPGGGGSAPVEAVASAPDSEPINPH